MKILTAEYVLSAIKPEHFPRDRRPEFAFAGRSNVGKSTLLNVLLRKKGLAKVSKSPGKTRAVNFFDINGNVYFVDLPGYGFAKVSKGLRETWGEVVTNYLLNRETLRLVLHLVDARHTPSDDDRQLLDLLEEAKVPVLVVATKADKLRPKERADVLDRLREGLGLDKDAAIVPFSSLSKEGLRELWRFIDDSLRS